MSELKWNWVYYPYLDTPNKQEESALKAGYIKVVIKEDVDKALAEKDDEIAELKQKLEDVNELIKTARQMLEDAKATHYAEMVDAGMRERRLRRALYKACANWAMNARMVEIEAEPWGENHESRLWASVYDKCIKKVKEYK